MLARDPAPSTSALARRAPRSELRLGPQPGVGGRLTKCMGPRLPVVKFPVEPRHFPMPRPASAIAGWAAERYNNRIARPISGPWAAAIDVAMSIVCHTCARSCQRTRGRTIRRHRWPSCARARVDALPRSPHGRRPSHVRLCRPVRRNSPTHPRASHGRPGRWPGSRRAGERRILVVRAGPRRRDRGHRPMGPR